MAITPVQRLARRALLARLKADSDLTGLVPVDRIYGQTVPREPVWPFTKFGPPSTIGRVRIPGCVTKGRLITFPFHAFARNRIVSGASVETAESHASRIGEAMEGSLDGKRWTLDDGQIIHTDISDMQLMPDGEPTAFHYFGQINVKLFV